MITLKGVDPRMIANNLTASNLIHPGDMIKDEMESRGLTSAQLAVQMGVTQASLNDMLNGKRSVTVEDALLLEAALGIDAQVWLRWQTEYDMQTVRTNKNFLKRLTEVSSRVAAL